MYQTKQCLESSELFAYCIFRCIHKILNIVTVQSDLLANVNRKSDKLYVYIVLCVMRRINRDLYMYDKVCIKNFQTTFLIDMYLFIKTNVSFHLNETQSGANKTWFFTCRLASSSNSCSPWVPLVDLLLSGLEVANGCWKLINRR